jgi:hypothetical protein
LLEKGSCSVFITVLRQHEIKCITVTINGSILSGMAFRIATLKRSWKKEELMLIMPHSIVGLSVMRQPLLQKITLRNERLHHGAQTA